LSCEYTAISGQYQAVLKGDVCEICNLPAWMSPVIALCVKDNITAPGNGLLEKTDKQGTHGKSNSGLSLYPHHDTHLIIDIVKQRPELSTLIHKHKII
jgi:hypothetical protein